MKDTKPRPQSAPVAEPAPARESADVALIHGVTAEGAVQIIRRRGDRIEAGALTPLREGAPIQGEVLSLRPRPSCPLVCDVDVHYAPPQANTVAEPERPASPLGHKGPALVASDRYRDNWDSIWSRKKSDALN